MMIEWRYFSNGLNLLLFMAISNLTFMYLPLLFCIDLVFSHTNNETVYEKTEHITNIIWLKCKNMRIYAYI
jgi:hypothetical protein